MDWTIFWLLALIGAGWFFTFTAGFNIGIKYERFQHDKEVDAYVIPEDRLSDGSYWKMRYEEAVNDLDEVVGPKSFPDVPDAYRLLTEEDNAPGEAAE